MSTGTAGSRTGSRPRSAPFVLRVPCHRAFPSTAQQNSLDWNDLERAASPVRDFPGSEYSYLGATGLGASSGQPTMTQQQVEEYERLMNGVIGASPHEDGWFDDPFVFGPDP